jgi:hypothetical protein
MHGGSPIWLLPLAKLPWLPSNFSSSSFLLFPLSKLKGKQQMNEYVYVTAKIENVY